MFKVSYERTNEIKELHRQKSSDWYKNHPEMIEIRSELYKGKHFSPRTEYKKGYKMSDLTKEKIRQSRLGKKWSIEIRKKMSESSKIEGSQERKYAKNQLRKTFEYRLWREAVFYRDNFTCIWCFKKGGRLQADHIKSWELYPALRLAIDNGRTLCVDCHKKTDTFGGKIKTLKKQNV